MIQSELNLRRKIKIAFFEMTLNHISIVLSTIELMKPYMDEFIVFCDSKVKNSILESLQPEYTDHVNFIIKENGQHNFSFLKEYRETLIQCDLFIIDEIFKERPRPLLFVFFLKILNPKVIYIIHGLNFWLNPNYKLNLFSAQLAFQRYFYLSAMDGLAVLSKNLKEYAESQNSFNKKISIIPFQLPNDIFKKYETRKIKIIGIPGNIAFLNRDYIIVFNAFENMLNRSEFCHLKIKLIGEVQGNINNKNIIEIARNINDKYGKEYIQYYSGRLPPKLFENEIITSDILLANLNVHYKTLTHSEIYGKTKESGIPFLCIKYGKPLLATADYRIMDILKNRTLIYKDENDLEDIFYKINNNEILIESLYEGIVESNEKFYNQSKKFMKEFVDTY